MSFSWSQERNKKVGKYFSKIWILQKNFLSKDALSSTKIKRKIINNKNRQHQHWPEFISMMNCIAAKPAPFPSTPELENSAPAFCKLDIAQPAFLETQSPRYRGRAGTLEPGDSRAAAPGLQCPAGPGGHCALQDLLSPQSPEHFSFYLCLKVKAGPAAAARSQINFSSHSL